MCGLARFAATGGIDIWTVISTFLPSIVEGDNSMEVRRNLDCCYQCFFRVLCAYMGCKNNSISELQDCSVKGSGRSYMVVMQ